jgi:DNA-directed RNA polymerase specialized sigma24 family protein/ribosome-associated translation inhibitor RaiA
MKTAISYRNISKLAHPDLEDLVGKPASRHLQRHLSHFPADVVRLRATLERSLRRTVYRARLRLGLPGGTLACGNESPEFGAALEQSLVELERQLERRIDQLRHENSWRRKERRAGLRQFKAALTDHDDAGRALFGELVGPLLPAFERFVQRELAYLQARGDLATGDPLVDDVADEALARACEKLPQRPPRLEPLPWLQQIAITVLQEEVSRQQAGESGRWVSLESTLPVQLLEPYEDDDDMLFEYWQPDEVVRLEDVMPATDGSTPEEAVSAREMRQLVTAILADLPTSWRRALLLCRVEALSPAAAAQVLGTAEDELGPWLMNADAFLKARLGELGLTPEAAGEPADYFIPDVAPASRLVRDFDDATRREAPG